MSEQSARERLEAQKYEAIAGVGYVSVVPFVAALAYGAEERREGIRDAARLACERCANPREYLAVVHKADWIHYRTNGDPNDYVGCNAGPIYDKLKVMEVEGEETKVTASSDRA